MKKHRFCPDCGLCIECGDCECEAVFLKEVEEIIDANRDLEVAMSRVK